jgi:soluble lytic murein transglycosylase-like protein
MKHVYYKNMFMDYDYRRDERLIIRIAVVLGVVIGGCAIFLAQQYSPPQDQVLPEDVWPVVYELSVQAELDPEFVYALAWAESGLNASARSSIARGMMQLTRPAWDEVTDESYRLAWDWQISIRVAIDYLVYCRDYLKSRHSFSYPLLAASYRYGPYYVADKQFDITLLKPPDNEIYQRIFAGNVRPVAPPKVTMVK